MKFNFLIYNIHKGRSFFLRKRMFHEFREIIHFANADIVFLQEVRDFHKKDFKIYQQNQLDFLSDEKYEVCYGKNCEYFAGHHGNGLLSKFPILESKNFDLSVNRFEQRGVLYNKLHINGQDVYSFCTHLNLRKNDRRKQVHLLNEVINGVVKDSSSPIILSGDFNDFDNGVAHEFKRLGFNVLSEHKTFPAVMPFFSLDKVFVKNLHFSHSAPIEHKSIKLSSDHLPVLYKCSLSIS